MKSFEYAAPKKLKDATALLSNRWGETEVLAGGTDLITCWKQGVTSPKRMISLRQVSGLDKIKSSRKELSIGSMVTLEALAKDDDVQELFPSLVTAIKGIGSAQIINVGTVGGDLCQRPRCWYFRNGHGLLARDGDVSLAREGDNRYHAIFGNDGSAVFVSASSLGPALVALGARISVEGPDGQSREMAAADFFRTPKSESERETALQPNEILTGITIPKNGLKNGTYEIRHRFGLDWPYVTASVACEVKDGVIGQASVVLGHVAPTPWVATAAGSALSGATVGEASAAKAGEAATTGAKPLSRNAYKVALVRAAVKRAVLAAVG